MTPKASPVGPTRFSSRLRDWREPSVVASDASEVSSTSTHDTSTSEDSQNFASESEDATNDDEDFDDFDNYEDDTRGTSTPERHVRFSLSEVDSPRRSSTAGGALPNSPRTPLTANHRGEVVASSKNSPAPKRKWNGPERSPISPKSKLPSPALRSPPALRRSKADGYAGLRNQNLHIATKSRKRSSPITEQEKPRGKRDGDDSDDELLKGPNRITTPDGRQTLSSLVSPSRRGVRSPTAGAAPVDDDFEGDDLPDYVASPTPPRAATSPSMQLAEAAQNQQAHAQTMLLATQTELEECERSHDQLQAELADSLELNDILTAQVTELRERLADNASSPLAELRDEHEEGMQSSPRLSASLEECNAARTQLESDLNLALDNGMELESENRGLQEQISDLLQKIEDLKEAAGTAEDGEALERNADRTRELNNLRRVNEASEDVFAWWEDQLEESERRYDDAYQAVFQLMYDHDIGDTEQLILPSYEIHKLREQFEKNLKAIRDELLQRDTAARFWRSSMEGQLELAQTFYAKSNDQRDIIAALREEIKRLQDRQPANSANAESNDEGDTVAGLKEEIARLQNLLNETQDSLKHCHEHGARLQAELDDARAQPHRRPSEYNELLNERGRLQERVRVMQSKIAELEKNKSNESGNVPNAEELIEQAQLEAQGLEKKLMDTWKRLTECEKHGKKLTYELDELKGAGYSAQKIREQQQADRVLDTLQQRADQARAALEDCEQDAADLAAKNESLKKKIASLERRTSQTSQPRKGSRNDDCQSKLAESRQALSECQQHGRELEAEIASLKKKTHSLEGRPSRPREESNPDDCPHKLAEARTTIEELQDVIDDQEATIVNQQSEFDAERLQISAQHDYDQVEIASLEKKIAYRVEEAKFLQEHIDDLQQQIEDLKDRRSPEPEECKKRCEVLRESLDELREEFLHVTNLHQCRVVELQMRIAELGTEQLEAPTTSSLVPRATTTSPPTSPPPLRGFNIVSVAPPTLPKLRAMIPSHGKRLLDLVPVMKENYGLDYIDSLDLGKALHQVGFLEKRPRGDARGQQWILPRAPATFDTEERDGATKTAPRVADELRSRGRRSGIRTGQVLIPTGKSLPRPVAATSAVIGKRHSARDQKAAAAAAATAASEPRRGKRAGTRSDPNFVPEQLPNSTTRKRKRKRATLDVAEEEEGEEGEEKEVFKGTTEDDNVDEGSSSLGDLFDNEDEQGKIEDALEAEICVAAAAAKRVESEREKNKKKKRRRSE